MFFDLVRVVQIVKSAELEMTMEFGRRLLQVESVALSPSEEIEVVVVVVRQKVLVLKWKVCFLARDRIGRKPPLSVLFCTCQFQI